MLLELSQRLGSVGTKDDVEALVLEDDADHLGQGDVVVDDEDARTHVTIVSRNRHKRRRLAHQRPNFSTGQGFTQRRCVAGLMTDQHHQHGGTNEHPVDRSRFVEPVSATGAQPGAAGGQAYGSQSPYGGQQGYGGYNG